MLKRTPMFLRVVVQGSNVDALNELDDTPLPQEQLFAYVAIRNLGSVHINAKGGRGGMYQRVEYRLVLDQPTDGQMRDSESWSNWCHSQPTPILA